MAYNYKYTKIKEDVTPETLAYDVVAINSKGELIVGTNKSISTWEELANGGHIWDDINGG